MTRIYSDFAYSNGPRDGCWWDDTRDLLEAPRLDTDIHCDVAIVGAGFTGLNAALRLAENGVDVVVLDAQHIGWGASGRNGGFCCLGGGGAGDAHLDRKYGKQARLAFRHTEMRAVDHVSDLISRLNLDVDRHSKGETELAHRARDVRDFETAARAIEENYGVTPQLTSKNGLHAAGMNGPFHGALTIPVGFGLNPRKYLIGVAKAAQAAGVRMFGNTSVSRIDGTNLHTKRNRICAQNVIVATNGYSSEHLPKWLAARYMPTQSNVLITRPITASEQANQGWTTSQMAYDTRHLLHYFRLMPDGRFLFGMRGGLRSSASAEANSRARVIRDFRRIFPEWSKVEVTHAWSGMVCVSRHLLPFAGPVPGHPGVFAALCYHGNGVAMGSFCGAKLADAILGQTNDPLPDIIQRPLAKFPLGRARRLLLPGVYAGYALADL